MSIRHHASRDSASDWSHSFSRKRGYTDVSVLKLTQLETQAIAVLLVIISVCCAPFWKTFVHNRKLRSISTIDPSDTHASYIGALRLLRDSMDMKCYREDMIRRAWVCFG
ncbi:hypothetical protein M378DRAFT_168331 [Amanita muscaria Koide BX008]|uniref:Uncharacterized protein n=1 Tax=Amanita muscaria (strain Koide BX008) TaxID=946122 RepID=A0A0C2T1H1_AMAMK|nr:hypothetical protein M378DRAFT_168331 [Amanita muscaria Koide BX008]